MEKKETNMDLGNQMVKKDATIMKIDKSRGIATMVRKPLIRFKQVLIQELKRGDQKLTHISHERNSTSFLTCFQIRLQMSI
jgi:hypothetical protein